MSVFKLTNSAQFSARPENLMPAIVTKKRGL